jgi:hypothetical protein
MSGLPWFKIAVLAALAWGSWDAWRTRPADPPPGILAPSPPDQQPLNPDSAAARALPRGDWELLPRARYSITARLLSRQGYRFDSMAEVSPLDFALGWGPMSDTRVLEALRIGQGGRFFSLSWRETPPLPAETLMQHSANVHIIPANSGIARRLDRVRRGEIVRLEGRLVDGERGDGMEFRTSLTRSDTGGGACEVLLVEDLAVLGPGSARLRT